MKQLNDILTEVRDQQITGRSDCLIKGISIDSRKVQPGDLFCAVKGTLSDGHHFIPQAIQKGAVAVLCGQLPENPEIRISWIRVRSVPEALGKVTSSFYSHPSRQLKLIGITGTNGKTSVATFLYQLFERAGYPSGLISTIVTRIHKETFPSTHTTPDVVTLNHQLSKMVKAGCAYAFIEVSSHALDQGRVAGLYFSGGVLTNLSHDHLDYHHNFRNYLSTKKKFFDFLPDDAFALINFDDKNGRVMVQNTRARIKGYGLMNRSGYKGKIIERSMEGTLVAFDKIELWLPFSGDFNVYNLLAVYGVAMELKLDREKTLKWISNLKPVPGRLESFHFPGGPLVIVDYAHTPDALKNVLDTIRQIRKSGSKIYTVVGAGGDRDKTKRPEMAQIGVYFSDLLVLTSDNPRSEDPEQIIEDMKKGIAPGQTTKVLSITNRTEAIRTACMMAREDDIVLVAGKGHETYQIIGNQRIHFDDREVVRACFAKENNQTSMKM